MNVKRMVGIRIAGGLGLAALAACHGPQATPLDYALGTERDYAALEQHSAATHAAAASGQLQTWTTPRGSSGSVRIAEGAAYQDRSGRQCRTLRQSARMPDQQIDRQVVACQEADGTWLVLEPDLAPAPKD